MARGAHKCDYRKFIKAYNAFVVEGKTLTEAQKICGMGKATMIKYFNMVLLNEPIPPGVFFDENGRLYSSSGRVLGAVGVADTLEDAISNAYAKAEKIKLKNAFYRKDIGKKALMAKTGE